LSLIHPIRRPSSGDPEDLWDFGTVRNASRPSTIGRAQNNIQVSGPPLTWENNGTQRSDGSGSSSPTTRKGSSSGSSGSMNSYSSSVTAKGELPPLPPSMPSTPLTPTSKRYGQQATVRNTPGSVDQDGTQRGARREPSDEYEDYGDQYLDEHRADSPSPRKQDNSQRLLSVEEDPLPDTTMLDSVILPAIASVKSNSPSIVRNCTKFLFSCFLEYLPKTQGWPLAHFNVLSLTQSASSLA
jgi:serine/threonine-protein kinase 24/25/MST4